MIFENNMRDRKRQNNEKSVFVRVCFRIGHVYQYSLAYIQTYQYLQLMRKMLETMLTFNTQSNIKNQILL